MNRLPCWIDQSRRRIICERLKIVSQFKITTESKHIDLLVELEKGHRDETRCEFTEVSRWKYVLHCEMFNKGDILLIERPVGEVMDALPPNLKQKKFALK